MYFKHGYINSVAHIYMILIFQCSAFRTLKMTSDGKIDQTTPQWIKVKVSHTIKKCLQMIMLLNI